MPSSILAEKTASISEFKQNPSRIVREAGGTVAILNHNTPEFYCIDAETYEILVARRKELEAMVETLIEELEDAEDRETIRKRQGQKRIFVTIDQLRDL
jgi:PHD/YefM family antitoxin component YafN of YafNO toxin-antitoxin module